MIYLINPQKNKCTFGVLVSGGPNLSTYREKSRLCTVCTWDLKILVIHFKTIKVKYALSPIGDGEM